MKGVSLESLDWNMNWKEMGYDSFEEIALITEIEADFHTVLEDTAFFQVNTPNKLVDYMKQKDSIF